MSNQEATRKASIASNAQATLRHPENVDAHQAVPGVQVKPRKKSKWSMDRMHMHWHGASTRLELIALKRTGRLPLPERPIRSRDDLSFTRRDDMGRLIVWFVEPDERPRYWENGVAIGRAWFEEVMQLAKHDASEAVIAMRLAYIGMAQNGQGIEDGFMAAMAEAAVAGIAPQRPAEPTTNKT